MARDTPLHLKEHKLVFPVFKDEKQRLNTIALRLGVHHITELMKLAIAFGVRWHEMHVEKGYDWFYALPHVNPNGSITYPRYGAYLKTCLPCPVEHRAARGALYRHHLKLEGAAVAGLERLRTLWRRPDLISTIRTANMFHAAVMRRVLIERCRVVALVPKAHTFGPRPPCADLDASMPLPVVRHIGKVYLSDGTILRQIRMSNHMRWMEDVLDIKGNFIL